MGREYLISLPLYLELGVNKKKAYYINLNGYRNWCYRVSNVLKQLYKTTIETKIQELPKLDTISTTYYIYYPTKRKFDLDNIGSVTAKFFQDSLVHYGKLEDDNYDFVKGVEFVFGGVDKDNPRVDVVIKELVCGTE